MSLPIPSRCARYGLLSAAPALSALVALGLLGCGSTASQMPTAERLANGPSAQRGPNAELAPSGLSDVPASLAATDAEQSRRPATAVDPGPLPALSAVQPAPPASLDSSSPPRRDPADRAPSASPQRPAGPPAQVVRPPWGERSHSVSHGAAGISRTEGAVLMGVTATVAAAAAIVELQRHLRQSADRYANRPIDPYAEFSRSGARGWWDR